MPSSELRVLFCADPLVPGRFDEHFAAEVASVRELGGTVASIDHDALLRGDATAAVRRVPRDSGAWWYRGWMIPSDRYAVLAAAMVGRGATLRVPPGRYRLAHELPRWYPTFADLTAESGWMRWPPGVLPTARDLQPVTFWFDDGPVVVKDYVKSRKHEWGEACFVPDVNDAARVTAVVGRMVELQDDSLSGGIVMRRFERYRQDSGRTVEARVWWVDGAPSLVTAHPDTPDLLPFPDLSAVAPAVAALGCAFVTTDLAQRDDGVWRVVEVGDGQVSDLPRGLDPTSLLARLAEPTTVDSPPACPSCGGAGTPILYGLPDRSALAAERRGELVLEGCDVFPGAPHWRCNNGHDWATSSEQLNAALGAVLDEV